MKNYNRRNFLKKSTLGAVAASTLSISCQENMSKSSPGKYMGNFADKSFEFVIKTAPAAVQLLEVSKKVMHLLLVD